MTTYQDPPLQSRRSVRQNERDSAVVPTTGPTPPPVAPDAPGEPLTYATQARPPAPEYEGPSFRARRTPDPVGDIPADGQGAPEGTLRPRDHSPEGRRSATPGWVPQYGGAGQPPVTPTPPPVTAPDPSSTFAPHAPVQPAAAPADPAGDEPIEHTLTRRELRALRDAHGITAETTGETAYPTPDAAVAAPVAPVSPVPPIPDAVPASDASPASTGTPLAAPSSRLDSALAEFDQLAGGRQAPAADAPPATHGRRAAVRAEEPVLEAPVAEVPVAAAPAAEALAPAAGPTRVAPELLGPQAHMPEPVPLVEPPAPAAQPPAAQAPAAQAPVAEPAVATPAPVAPAPQPEPEVIVAEVVPEPVAPVVPETHEQIVDVVVEPSTSTPPTGHWSTQAQLDDETQFGDEKLARNIGSTSGAVTTSALVLPSIPDHAFGPITSLDGTVTGSISLPASLSATGAHPAQLDESDLDHLLDPGDHQVANTDSQPVRAIKAVSTHTSSRGVIGTVKPKGTKGLTALIIAATGMAVLVGALFIVLVVTGQLG
ncbi:MAG TPA: hypothetical protein VL294_09575 [Pseudolysinimonas sp.]|jgi:hypothetical protein|nr:hypothetical protein [Pseudolysinimonas sp.]